MSSPVPSSELSTFSISGKQLADAGTQTDGEFAVCDATATPTLNITLPTTSQLSIVRIEESNPQGKTENNRRMSTIIVSSKPGGATLEGGSGDDRSIVSINVPKRFSVSSVSSMKFAEDAGRRDHRGSRTGSIFITHGDSEEILAIDVVPTAGAPDVKDMSTAAKDAHEFKYPDQRSEESVPAPAYEEVVGSHSISEPPVAQDTLNSEPAAVNPKVPEETNVESSVVEVISEGIQTASEISPQDMTLDSPKANEGSLKTNLSSLPKLPPLGTRDFISQVEIAKGIQRQLEDWPVLKAGLLFRKPVPSSSSSRSLHSSSTSLQLRAPERSSARRILGRSLGSLLKGKRKTREVPNFKATFLPEEDEWSLYYAEVRGRYLVFYVLQPMMGQQERGGSGTLVRQSSSLSVGTRDSSSSTRPFSKFLKSFAKKSQASLSSRKVSRDSLERVSYESSRASYDQQRSYLSHLTPEDLKNAPRTLVHYIPLHTATVDAVHSSKPGSTSAYASTSSLTGGSILVLSTLPVEHPEEDTREYLLLDVILHEDLLDVNNELTVSTVNSNVRDAQSTLRQVELSHWMGAIQEASDLSPPMDEPTPGSDKNSSSKSLPDLMQERKMSRESLSPVARTPTDQTSISAKSLHVSPSHGGLASIQESPSASQYAKGVFRKHSRTPTEGSLPSLHQLYSDSLSFRQTARSEVLSSSASVSEHPISGSRELQPPALPKSFAKLFSNKWRNTFDKDAPRARPVISGPTNFTKVEVTPATLLGQAAATGPSSPTSPVSNVQTAEGSDAPPSAEAVVKEEQKRSGWRGLHRKPVEREEIRDRSGKNKEKEGKREPGKRKDSKAGLSPLVISSPIPQPTNSTLPLQQRDNSHPTDTLLSLAQLQQSNAGFSTKPTPQPSVATSKLFFPFFHKNLFAGKEKEIPIVISPAAERLQRSGTVSSRASTMRRRVGRARPESAETMSSDRGTIGSAFRRAEGEVPLTLRKCIELVEEIGKRPVSIFLIQRTASSLTILPVRRIDDGRPLQNIW
ncbi:uncharacterized protein EV422DRAFT_6037 [Fimicolochytrium jonesii]|uniref:uncharacterized protein n=1 Tax=Fimicolochytrium jonesii TaxID=1396493 RepID=UPI0022FE93FC|nr:uncharacterized protein EV422DRAFT_6037 [Fimicolochytrium jonesii]KAI8826670.1 hypothetical protein EV422DRAFT_6037 [Fimicolochytrium jonesii]